MTTIARCLLTGLLAVSLLGALPAAAEDDKTPVTKKANKTPDMPQALNKAAKTVKESRLLFSTILDHKDEAQAKKQTLRWECVLVQETESKGLMRIAEDALKAMKTAAANNDPESVTHEMVKIDVAAEKIMKASAQADLCGDEIRNYDGPTIIEVEEPEDKK